MKTVQQQAKLHEEKFKGASVAPLVVMALFLTSILIVPSLASAAPSAPADEPATATEKPAAAEPTADAEALDLAEQWGIEVTSIRLSTHDHMIDYRYRVLDADKAADLFKRQIKPRLIHQKTGQVLVVPDTAKLGPLRNSNIPRTAGFTGCSLATPESWCTRATRSPWSSEISGSKISS